MRVEKDSFGEVKLEKKNFLELKESIAKIIPSEVNTSLVGDLIKQGDMIILVVPIDLGASITSSTNHQRNSR